MTYEEAMHEVVHHNKTVQRKAHQFEGYDKGESSWSSWMRIRMEDDHFPPDALIFIESNYWGDVEGRWLHTWWEENLSKDDILEDNWEVVEEPTAHG